MKQSSLKHSPVSPSLTLVERCINFHKVQDFKKVKDKTFSGAQCWKLGLSDAPETFKLWKLNEIKQRDIQEGPSASER